MIPDIAADQINENLRGGNSVHLEIDLDPGLTDSHYNSTKFLIHSVMQLNQKLEQ